MSHDDVTTSAHGCCGGNCGCGTAWPATANPLMAVGLDLSPRRPGDPPPTAPRDAGWIVPGLERLAEAGLPGLAEVLAAFDDQAAAWTRWGFLMHPSTDFDGLSPLDWLARGNDAQPVIRHARHLHQLI